MDTLLKNVRTRYAPSPTGFLHVGQVRTALFNFLFARKHGGNFILRIEDTDIERSEKKYERAIFQDIGWLGIDPDEGPKEGGPFGPYRQSERSASYRRYIEKLLEEEKVFYCFHSEEELEEEKAKLREMKRPQFHFCEFRNMPAKDAEILIRTKPNHIIRFKTPAARTIVFHDLIRGEIAFVSELLGDFSIAKNLRTPLYNFAVVIDDYEMRISHVIRGEDHIPNTPKQLLILEALGFPRPIYAHMPLVLHTDRSKLSKRDNAVSIRHYREEGYLPEAMRNFISLLGWNPGNNQEIFSMKDLIRSFSIEAMQKSGAVFDERKLEWMNAEYIKNMPLRAFCQHAKKILPRNKKTEKYVRKILELEKPRLKKLSELKEKTGYFFKKPKFEPLLLIWKTMSNEEVFASLETSEALLLKVRPNAVQAKDTVLTQAAKKKMEQLFLEETKKSGDKGRLLWPLRVALTGKEASPGPFEIIEIIGISEARARLAAAKSMLYRSLK